MYSAQSTTLHQMQTQPKDTRRSAKAEILQVGGHYAVQGHSTSLNLVPIESPYATSY